MPSCGYCIRFFFLFRDGRSIAAGIKRAAPLGSRFKAPLFDKFVAVIRATVRGNVVVALAQGALGGIIFWLLDVRAPALWGALMAVLSLLPAVGAAIVWGPVAIYFLLSGATCHGVFLILFGMLVIGLVDNILRPILVCKDTKLPDYLVLLSTLGGMGLFGPSGFIIGPVIAALFIAAWSLFVRSRSFSGQEITTNPIICFKDNSVVDSGFMDVDTAAMNKCLLTSAQDRRMVFRRGSPCPHFQSPIIPNRFSANALDRVRENGDEACLGPRKIGRSLQASGKRKQCVQG